MPVVVSIDVVVRVELADAELGLLRPIEHRAPRAMAPAFRRLRTGGSESSGMVKSTEIGCTWMMMQMLVASPIVT